MASGGQRPRTAGRAARRTAWFAALALAGAAVALIAAPASAVIPEPVASDTAGLSVNPSTGLFNVTLWPGESTTAVASLENHSPVDMRIRLTPVETGWSGAVGAFDALTLAGARTADCSVASMARVPGVPMSAAQNLDQGILPAGERAELCLRVSYDAQSELDQPAMSYVNLAFTGFEHGRDGGVRPPLPITGAQGQAILAGVAMATILLVAGTATLATRHRKRR